MQPQMAPAMSAAPEMLRILGLEDHDVVGRLGGLVLAQGKVHAVLLGAGLERPDVRLRDFNVGQGRTMGFQLFQALLAVVQLWPLGPVLQIFFQGSLQRLGGELARFHGQGNSFLGDFFLHSASLLGR